MVRHHELGRLLGVGVRIPHSMRGAETHGIDWRRRRGWRARMEVRIGEVVRRVWRRQVAIRRQCWDVETTPTMMTVRVTAVGAEACVLVVMMIEMLSRRALVIVVEAGCAVVEAAGSIAGFVVGVTVVTELSVVMTVIERIASVALLIIIVLADSAIAILDKALRLLWVRLTTRLLLTAIAIVELLILVIVALLLAIIWIVIISNSILTAIHGIGRCLLEGKLIADVRLN